MKLYLITDGANTLRTRIFNALRRGGLFGIMDEFGVDLNRARQYSSILSANSEYSILLHQIRAPQCLYKLLHYYGINKKVISKLIKFYVENWHIINRHKPSPANNEVIRQLDTNERLVGMVDGYRKQLEEKGYNVELVPWYKDIADTYPDGVYFVFLPINRDIVDELIKAEASGDTTKEDILNGLAFGYKMSDILRYAHHDKSEFIDKLCNRNN